MYGWVDGCLYGWMDVWIDVRIDVWMDVLDGNMHGWMYGCIDIFVKTHYHAKSISTVYPSKSTRMNFHARTK